MPRQAPVPQSMSILGNTTRRPVAARSPYLGGPHQFGLFIGQDRSGITVQGVDAKGRPINDYRKVQAFITTNATNNFGYSGIFVEGDGVTISGLGIGRNIPGQNKTIEVIGDDFALADCNISDTQGSVYINDFRFDTVNNVSHVQSYDIEDNNFQDGVSIDIRNGAGFSGPVQNRVIKYNNFANSSSQPSISFNGSDTGVPWFVQSVGGAVIQDNTFVNIFTWTTGDDPSLLLTEGHIHARGTYNDSQFDWNTYFNFNKFDRAYATGPQPPTNLREYTYDGSYGTIQHVRRIGALLAGEQAIAQPGDKTVP